MDNVNEYTHKIKNKSNFNNYYFYCQEIKCNTIHL